MRALEESLFEWTIVEPHQWTSGVMEVHVVPTPKKLFEQMPAAEREFLLHALHAANEINVLLRLFRYTSPGPEDGPEEGLVARANMVQALTVVRLLTVKLDSTATLIHKRYVKTNLGAVYGADMGKEGSESLRRLMQYFSNRNNPITLVRNKFAAHYDTDQLEKYFKNAPENDHWEIVLADQYLNTLYFAPEVVSTYAMTSTINAGDPLTALEHLMSEVSQVVSWINTFIGAILMVAVDKRLGGFDAWDSNLRQVALPDAPPFDEVKVPFFVAVPKESQDARPSPESGASLS